MLPEDQRHENHNSANHHPDWKKNKKQPQEDNREDSQQYHGCPGQNQCDKGQYPHHCDSGSQQPSRGTSHSLKAVNLFAIDGD
ncbi:MAG: hypothetical protein ACYC0O_09380 [Desulfurivibrionaceae bacterium]|nr:hypothetical protein [Pseudomonadota bacterium]MCG2824202.1 hypothetical protein [Desulfobulbaceae bacterium]MDP2001307.1 hypothetical protein [Desulfurivibrionaceae bacterium]MBU4408253.1 hypothetical protein [Pseudomonadota bacterium]MBU4412176.1 hypothetical protein [Pseudomonadota bacterium]